jgi:hypothetical protein
MKKKIRFQQIFATLFVVFIVCAPSQAATKSVTAASKATVVSTLELTVSQQGSSELKFGNLVPSAIDPTVAGPLQVRVDVQSNSGERYQVVQHINGPLTNGQTGQITPENLKFTSLAMKTTGMVVSTLTPLATTSQLIFTSNTNGTSDTILLDYTLVVPPGQAPGNYSAQITYTVSTL